MKKSKCLLLMIIICTFLMCMLSGCENSTIQSIAISNQKYTSNEAVDEASQSAKLTKDKTIYACVHFIESPKGMKYTAKWFLNNTEIKTDEKEMTTDKTGVIVYPLETDKLKNGTLKLQIVYKDRVLIEKKVSVK